MYVCRWVNFQSFVLCIVVVVVVGVWLCSFGIVISLLFLRAVFIVWRVVLKVFQTTFDYRFQIVILRFDLDIGGMVWVPVCRNCMFRAQWLCNVVVVWCWGLCGSHAASDFKNCF